MFYRYFGISSMVLILCYGLNLYLYLKIRENSIASKIKGPSKKKEKKKAEQKKEKNSATKKVKKGKENVRLRSDKKASAARQ